MSGIMFHDGTRGMNTPKVRWLWHQDWLVFSVVRDRPFFLSCLSSPPPAIVPFYAGCPLELLFFDVCAWILTSAYFDILHFQQLWANHLQAVPGFILQVTGCLPKVCFLIRYAKPFKTFSFLVFLTVWSSVLGDMASESGCHFGTTPPPPHAV